MKVTPKTYVPVLKWRQGEYQALMRLVETAKDSIVPLIIVPDIEYDFEERKPRRTVQEQVEPFAGQFLKKWGERPAWIDVDAKLRLARMPTGESVFTYVFRELAAGEGLAVPVASLDHPMDAITDIAAIVGRDGHGVAIRARLEHIMRADFADRFGSLVGEFDLSNSDVDLIVDLGSPDYEPYEAFATALTAALKRIPRLDDYRTFVLVGTAFPNSLGSISPPGDVVPRHDWRFYQSFLAGAGKRMRRPCYGDYTIVHPTFEARDMRKVKAAGKVIYTEKLQWNIRKGGAFRGNEAQMHGHCALVVKSDAFRGARFSEGDRYISDCAKKEEGPSNLTKWKEVAISHHAMHVLDDLANLLGSP